MIELTASARAALLPDRVLLFDWHRMAMCCAAAGETSLRRVPRRVVAGRNRYRPLPSDPPGLVFAHALAFPHLATRDVVVDYRRWLGMPRFISDLPDDFGLRASLGRLP
jgi:hypothetical protein